jgi:hypothetical protein
MARLGITLFGALLERDDGRDHHGAKRRPQQELGLIWHPALERNAARPQLPEDRT